MRTTTTTTNIFPFVRLVVKVLLIGVVRNCSSFTLSTLSNTGNNVRNVGRHFVVDVGLGTSLNDFENDGLKGKTIAKKSAEVGRTTAKNGNLKQEAASVSNFSNNNKSDVVMGRRSLLLQSMSGAAVSAITGIILGSVPAAANAGTLVDESESRRIKIFEETAPSVVFIDTFAERRDVFSTNIMEVPIGTGSGFIWDDQGHIVTNFHVVRNANSAQVAILTKGGGSGNNNLFDGVNPYTAMRPNSNYNNGFDATTTGMSVYKAKVIGVDATKDIAVLKVEAPKSELTPIAIGTSTGIKVGQQALAIGNPFGLDHTLTAGIISGTGREVKSPIGRPISNVIQTDAAINPGNSGGPLLDMSGKLIGMNTAIYSPSGGSAGIGFAIPVDTVKIIADALIRDGKIVRPVLGISFLESKQARALGITSGVLVLDVPTNSPAYRAGLRGTRRTESGLIEIGDIIVKVEKKPIKTETDLFKALEDCRPGDNIDVVVARVQKRQSSIFSNADDEDDDGYRLVEVTLTIELQPSTIFEQDASNNNNMKIYQYER